MLSRHEPLHRVVTMHEICDDAANSLVLVGDLPAFAHQQQPRFAIPFALQSLQLRKPRGTRRLQNAEFLCRRCGVSVELNDADEGLKEVAVMWQDMGCKLSVGSVQFSVSGKVDDSTGLNIVARVSDAARG